MQGVLAAGAIAWLFYQSFWPAIFFLLLYPQYMRGRRETERIRRQERLCLQFKDGIAIMSSMLSAGHAVENTIIQSADELASLWGEDADMVIEFRRMGRQLSIGISVEQVWQEFAQRSGLEEIMDFAQIFYLVKRSGGGLLVVILRAVRQITDQLVTKEQIQTQITAKQFEQKIMSIMPLVILFYISVTSKDMLAVMYQTLMGRVVMSICLIIYAIAWELSRKIMRIKY